MPVITCTLFQTTKHDDFAIHWSLDINGIDEPTEITQLEEIQVFSQNGLVLSTTLYEDDSETSTSTLYRHFPPMEKVTAILNRLNGLGYRIVGCTNVTNFDMRQFVMWTFEK